MNEAASIIKDAEQLPPIERIKLVEHLLDTLDKPDPEIDAVWADESERRLEAYLCGEAKTLAATDVLARHLKP
jgi:putative addiction module component (TIGR02574 family)